MLSAVMHALVSMFLVVYIAQTLYLHSEWLPLETCTGGLVLSSTCTIIYILHVQIATCTVMVVHGSGSGVMEVVPWNGSMWWLLYINI